MALASEGEEAARGQEGMQFLPLSSSPFKGPVQGEGVAPSYVCWLNPIDYRHMEVFLKQGEPLNHPI